ncbi:MAG TPA: LysR family transcriptional regulator [Actinobacteria bacterium]|nr:LysR family transcriptional regulator [Actinomycetota bacterium]
MSLEDARRSLESAREAQRRRPSLSTQQLHLFAEAYRLRSLSDAADVLFMSQPTASRTLKALEDRLGVTLFTRTPHGLEPTEAADRLFPGIARALEELHAAVGLVADLGHASALRIGAAPEMLVYVAPAIRTLATEREGSLGHLRFLDGDALVRELLHHELDVAVLPAVADQVPEGIHAASVRRVRFALHRPARPGARAELLAIPPAGSWERTVLDARVGPDHPGPWFETTGGAVAKKLLAEGFSVYLPLACTTDLTDVVATPPVFTVELHALTLESMRPGDDVTRFVELLRSLDLPERVPT